MLAKRNNPPLRGPAGEKSFQKPPNCSFLANEARVNLPVLPNEKEKREGSDRPNSPRWSRVEPGRSCTRTSVYKLYIYSWVLIETLYINRILLLLALFIILLLYKGKYCYESARQLIMIEGKRFENLSEIG